jgi:outer membrane protein
MKKGLILVLLSLLTLSSTAFGQRFGYMDSQEILKAMPEYQDVEKQIETLTQVWLSEIEALQQTLDSMQGEYKAGEILMPPDLKAEKRKEIVEQQNKVREYQNNAFGYNGLLFLKRQELMKPIQDKVAEAAKAVARKKNLNFIFDKAADIVMIYSDPRHNYTDYILEEMDLGDPVDTPR